MSSVQLVFIRDTLGRYCYGELADGHIFRSSSRYLFRDDLSRILSADWVTRAKGRVFELEGEGGWAKVYVTDVPYCFTTKTCYIIPCFQLNRIPALTDWLHLHKKTTTAPAPAPALPLIVKCVTFVDPKIALRSTPKAKASEPLFIAKKRRDSMSSTDAVVIDE